VTTLCSAAPSSPAASAASALHFVGRYVMRAGIVRHVGQVRDRIAVKHFAHRLANLRCRGTETAHAGFADHDHAGPRPEEAHRLAQLPLHHQAQRPRQFRIDQRADQRARRRLDRIGQSRQPLDHQCRGDRAQFLDRHHVEEPALDQFGVQFVTGQRERHVVHRRRGIATGQAVDEVENLDLVLVEGEVHQRGSHFIWVLWEGRARRRR
jgi:hypothetical protein